MSVIHIAAALMLDPQGRTLLVRKRGTQAFMQPGGKLEPGETPVQALVREIEEELGVRVEPQNAEFLGKFSAPAANEPGCEVQCQLFKVTCNEPVAAAAELEEVMWVTAEQAQAMPLAPLTRDSILPIFRTLVGA